MTIRTRAVTVKMDTRDTKGREINRISYPIEYESKE